MPIGAKGQKRQTDPFANAIHVMRVATDDTEEPYVNAGQSEDGQNGGRGSMGF